MSEKYYLIQGKNWGNKIHIILPTQLSWASESIEDKELSKEHKYSGWCKTDTKGYIKTPEEIPDKYLYDEDIFCQDCISKAMNSKLSTPKFLNKITH